MLPDRHGERGGRGAWPRATPTITSRAVFRVVETLQVAWRDDRSVMMAKRVAAAHVAPPAWPTRRVSAERLGLALQRA